MRRIWVRWEDAPEIAAVACLKTGRLFINLSGGKIILIRYDL